MVIGSEWFVGDENQESQRQFLEIVLINSDLDFFAAI
jgi:hypothetical protein